ncbi:DUF3099 domain-containing protein [Actinomadura sp. DC4]|uniref:DUF3099 domain-containing protein n=1 Tax=Actinomadura sp. DC4 TaxID=3055069 RepID=UPI0025B019AD|nr:DUF3099 domain-containing protein [Actinomadura sp. DC4]MDN3355284.1 DUF3099 domain-containing protein [Actinomadura sp. DC4]
MNIFRRRRQEAVYTVTDARRPMSEDIGYRERRYLITMGVRALCFLLSILFAVTLHGAGRWLALAALAGAVVLPYVAVVFANGGREPDSSARFAPYEGESQAQKPISGPRDQIGS